MTPRCLTQFGTLSIAMPVTCLLVVCLGCGGGPTPIPALHVDASGLAARAIELYDQDGDGQLSAKEMQASPALTYAFQRADSDEDGSFSESELQAMMTAWNEKSTGLYTIRCNVRRGRKPVANAKVRFVPAEFLAGTIEPAFGITDDLGDAFLSIPKDKRPIPDSPPGVQFGLYRVEISQEVNGRERISAKYNQETTLGQEVCYDDPGVLNGIVFKLK